MESLIALLRDESSTVRQEAANALGAVFWRDRSASRRGAHHAAKALAQYLDEHPDDCHYFTLTALGATGDRVAKPVLETAAQVPEERLRKAAERGLANLSR
ncbi:MAG: HEAT repeat domain-containing protein [Candidatus Dormibacteraeota bacterium]|uniref:HEAT repeat domain-containing protein n=1 Tax=Candidatus Dormiibacter inghamiae TaxID=3127013 RepID=A0A934KIP0_9BACT|nr:HEAT repeat domain-containing protein [Candidatus Dormibacteraeota bacterium]MBJ7606380.1 HEAT repeat domain-containing protein [Candidatus Dormibacteraeota bacterium]